MVTVLRGRLPMGSLIIRSLEYASAETVILSPSRSLGPPAGFPESVMTRTADSAPCGHDMVRMQSLPIMSQFMSLNGLRSATRTSRPLTAYLPTGIIGYMYWTAPSGREKRILPFLFSMGSIFVIQESTSPSLISSPCILMLFGEE